MILMFCYFSSESMRNTIFNKLIIFWSCILLISALMFCQVKSGWELEFLLFPTTGQLEYGYFRFFISYNRQMLDDDRLQIQSIFFFGNIHC